MTLRELALYFIRSNSIDSEFDGRGWRCLACGASSMILHWQHLRHSEDCVVAQVLRETSP